MIDNKKVIAFVTAAGTGTRMQLSIPKQFLTIDDIPLCFYPLQNLQKNKLIDEIMIAIPYGWSEYVQQFGKYLNITKLKHIVIGGDTIFNSIQNMLDVANAENKEKSYVICLIDGNRMMFDDILQRSFDNYIINGNTNAYFNPYAISFYNDEHLNLIDRNKIIVTCTPHIYSSESVNATSDYVYKNNAYNEYVNQILVKLGYSLSFVKCSICNIKVTYQDDLEMVKALIHERKRNELSR